MKKLLAASCSVLLTGYVLCAADYREQYKVLAAKAAELSKKFWQGKHFGDHPYAEDAKVYDGRNVHDYTMLYWNFMDAQLNGNRESLNRALSHYKFTVDHFWDGGLKRFRTGYDFLSNASIMMSMLLSLRDARDVIPPGIQKDMRNRIRDISAYLPTYTTALRNDKDLRANNQDSFASFALAMASAELGDRKIRREALMKFRSVLERVQQSFWIEGGVDIGYQSVGEPAYMAAADLLWDDLTRDEKLKIANLQLNNVAGNGFGLENARSSSWINPAPIRTFSSALLGRVPNGFIAADAEELFLKTAKNGFPGKWWLHDPAALSFFSGFYKYMPEIAKIGKRSDSFASGSLACHIMERDEQGASFTGMEKAYLTGGRGTTAIFGDYSRLHPDQLHKKFGAARMPYTPNPGGLRYMGKGLHLYVIADGELGAPRLFSDDSTRYPQMLHRSSCPGAGASEYILTQILPGMNDRPAITVRQSYAVIGDVLVCIFYAPEKIAGLSYGVTLPLTSFSRKDNTVTIRQKGLADGKAKCLKVTSFNVPQVELDRDRRQPFFRNEFKVNGKNVKMPLLRLIKFQFGKGQVSALVFSPEGNAENIRMEERDGIFSLEFSCGKMDYAVAAACAPAGKLNRRIGKNEIAVLDPLPGYLQVAGFSGGKLKSIAVNGRSFSWNGKVLFDSKTNRTVSAEVFSDAVLFTCDGEISLKGVLGKTGHSLVDGAVRSLPAIVPAERMMIQMN